MKIARRILLILTIIAVALLDLSIGMANYNDRGGWFAGLEAMLAFMFLMPALLGLLLGVYFGLDELSWHNFVRAAVTSCVALPVHGLISAVIYIFTSSDVNLSIDALWFMPLWSIVVGLCAAAAGMLATLAIVALVKYIKRRSKPDEG